MKAPSTATRLSEPTITWHAQNTHTQSSVNSLLHAWRAAKQPHLQFDVSDAKLISRDEHRAAGHTYIITATQW